MRRILLLFLILGLLLVACGEDKDGDMDDEAEDDETETETSETGDDESGSKIPGTVETGESADPEEIMKELEKQQNEVLLERAEVFKEKRNILDTLLDKDLAFEDRQFYTDALGIIKARESELTLQATILESRLVAMKKRLEGQETVDVYTEVIAGLKVKKQEYIEKLNEVAGDIIDVRQKWYDAGVSAETLEEMKSELEPLEDEEENLLSAIVNIDAEIAQKQSYIDEISGVESPKDQESLLIQRQQVSAQLDVVRNKLARAVIASKDLVGDSLALAKEEIDRLKDEEDDYDDELHEIDQKLGYR